MNERIEKRLLDLKARQDKDEHMPCPRCGKDAMNRNVFRNALSRHADIQICDECGTAEAMLDFMQNPLPLDQWACLLPDRPQSDFKALSGAEAWALAQFVVRVGWEVPETPANQELREALAKLQQALRDQGYAPR